MGTENFWLRQFALHMGLLALTNYNVNYYNLATPHQVFSLEVGVKG